MKHPDALRSVESYRRLAPSYDTACRPITGVRAAAVAHLHLRRGDVVLDVGCGTGLGFPLLLDAIGPEGHLVGLEHSPQMMDIARQRVLDAEWRNVTLLERTAQRLEGTFAFDAVLFHFTHDVLQSPEALASIFALAKPGARVAAAGTKFAPWWLAPLNLWVAFRVRHYVSTYRGMRQPWLPLQRYVPDLVAVDRPLRTSYLAHGTFREAVRA